MKRSILVVLAATAVAALAACGEKPRAVRLAGSAGMALVYDLHLEDDWPGGAPAHGGKLVTDQRLLMTCLDHVPGKRTAWETAVEWAAAEAPPRFALALDTRTPEAEPDDVHGVEAAARPFAGTRGEVLLDPFGVADPVEPNRELQVAMMKWAGPPGPDHDARKPAGAIAIGLMDGARTAGQWWFAAALLLPSEASIADGASWTSAPERPSIAGQLICDMEHELSRAGDLVTMEATGRLRAKDKLHQGPIRFVSGTYKGRLVVDVARGVIVEFEDTTVVSQRGRDAAADTAPNTRTSRRRLTLVE